MRHGQLRLSGCFKSRTRNIITQVWDSHRGEVWEGTLPGVYHIKQRHEPFQAHKYSHVKL